MQRVLSPRLFDDDQDEVPDNALEPLFLTKADAT